MIELKNKSYHIKKIGNRDKPENRNQDSIFDFTGVPMHNKVEIDSSVRIVTLHEWFATSKVRSIYQHGTENDKLVLPKDFPVSKDLNIPELKDNDILLATMNSVYLLREADE